MDVGAEAGLFLFIMHKKEKNMILAIAEAPCKV